MTSSFSLKTIAFLTEAGQQNDPLWLDAQADRYDKLVKAPFVDLAVGLKAALQPQLPNYHFPTQGIGRIKKNCKQNRCWHAVLQRLAIYFGLHPVKLSL